MKKYLYGASVQGIQGYIFSTNELKQIVGASELVERACTSLFSESLAAGAQPVVTAAGNIKYIFSDRTALENAVRLFPKLVAETAPGITVSQAVVTMDGDYADFRCAVNELERRLMVQRNRPMKSLTAGLMAVERSRKTGLQAVECAAGDEFLDEPTIKKTAALADNMTTLKLMKKLTGEDVTVREVALDIKDLTGRNDWIAVIHADGNGLGEVVARVGDDPDKLREFSLNLDNATKAAAQKAYQDIGYFSLKLPVRPVVLSGDDMTVICRADIAVEFVKSFLAAFEEETQKLIGHKLTACAGIAFIKSSYPFHYGYSLAETLCAEAKRDAKSPDMKRDGLAPSCLMMHKVQSGFIEDWAEIERKELTTKDKGSYIFGPYYLNEQPNRWTVVQLESEAYRLTDGKDGNAAKTDIREWLTLMADNVGLAEQKANRVNAIDSKKKDSFNEATKGVERGGKLHYPAYDMLSLVALEIKTKKDKTKTCTS